MVLLIFLALLIALALAASLWGYDSRDWKS
jgi:hypothetical protein